MPKKDGLALAASLRRRYPGPVIWGRDCQRAAAVAGGVSGQRHEYVSV